MSYRYNITISSAAAANNKLYLHLIEHDQWIREDYYLPNALGWHGFNGKYFSGRYFDHNFSPIDMISRSRHKIHRCIIEKVVPYWDVENLSARFKKEFYLFLFSRSPFAVARRVRVVGRDKRRVRETFSGEILEEQ